jgi:hypothetical protein
MPTAGCRGGGGGGPARDGASGLVLATVGVFGGDIRALGRLTKDDVGDEDAEDVGVPDGAGESGVGTMSG